MLTKLVISILFCLDGAVVAMLVVSDVSGAWGIGWRVLVAHILFSALIMRLLATFFPVLDGDFEEGSAGFDRWQAQAFVACLSCTWLDGMLPIFLKAQWYMLFGARVAWNAKIAGRILDCSLVEMGPGTTLGSQGLVMGHFQVGNRVRVGRVRIGPGGTVGVRAVVFPGATIGDGATVGASALVVSGKHVPPGETWGGIPARRIKSTSFASPRCTPGPVVDSESEEAGNSARVMRLGFPVKVEGDKLTSSRYECEQRNDRPGKRHGTRRCDVASAVPGRRRP